MISQLQSVFISHIFREGNRCADWAANVGRHLSSGCHMFVDLPNPVLELAKQDVMGGYIASM